MPMKAPASIALPGALAALLAIGLAVPPSGNSLGAFSSVLTPLADADLDGLDDALEARLKTDPGNPDSDGDTVSDLEEALLGTDPNVADLPSAFPALAPKLYIDAYALGTDMVIQIAAHFKQSVLLPTFTWADDDSLLTLSISDLRAFRVDHGVRPSARANWSVASARFLIPRAVVENEPSVGIAIQAIIDGVGVAAATMFTHVNGYLAQFRVGVGSAAMSWSGNGAPGFQGTPALYTFGGETSPTAMGKGVALIGYNWLFERLEENLGCDKVMVYYQLGTMAAKRLHDRYWFVPQFVLDWRKIGPFRFSHRLPVPEDYQLKRPGEEE